MHILKKSFFLFLLFLGVNSLQSCEKIKFEDLIGKSSKYDLSGIKTFLDPESLAKLSRTSRDVRKKTMLTPVERQNAIQKKLISQQKEQLEEAQKTITQRDKTIAAKNNHIFHLNNLARHNAHYNQSEFLMVYKIVTILSISTMITMGFNFIFEKLLKTKLKEYIKKNFEKINKLPSEKEINIRSNFVKNIVNVEVFIGVGACVLFLFFSK